MPVSKRTVLRFAAALFFSLLIASCTFNQPSQINVTCDTDDLIQAIHDANADTDLTTLILDTNCTYPFDSKDNEDGGQGPNALPIVTTNIIIQGNDSTLLRVGQDGFRFFFITGTGSLRLEDLTLEDGYAVKTSNDQPDPRGAAVYNDGGALNTQRSVFRSNWATHGGAIYNLGTLMVGDETLFEVNTAREDGGAIYNGGDVGIPALIQDATFSSNRAENGGAIYDSSPETGLTISGSEFVDNIAYIDGGAIYLFGGDLSVSYSTFTENQAGKESDPFRGDGGAINIQAGDANIINTEFYFQEAYGVGGAIYSGPDATLALKGIRLESNMACHGGAALYLNGTTEILETTLYMNFAGHYFDLVGGEYPIYKEECWGASGGAIFNEGTLSLSRSLINRNSAMNTGDGIFNHGDLMVVNTTFTDNEYRYSAHALHNIGNAEVNFATFVGNGLGNSGTLLLNNVIVANSTAYDDCINVGTLQAIGENIGFDATCTFNIYLPSYSQLGVDPNLADHGGPTLTHEIYTLSPALNAATCTTASGDPVTEDQRGISRPQGGSMCDIGAFEIEWLWTSEDIPPTATGAPEPETPMACAPQNTTCREGDSSEYEALGYLLEGECAPVVGQNQAGTWLVIINPDWEGECWVLRDLVETEGDVDGTEVRYAPALPVKTPTEQMGCWVQDTRGGDPVCTVPCPDGAEPGTPCTP